MNKTWLHFEGGDLPSRSIRARTGEGRSPNWMPGWEWEWKWKSKSKWESRCARFGWLLVTTGMLWGCAGSPSLSDHGQVASLHLFAAPDALNLDAQPGVDAVGLRLYASGAKTSRGIAIVTGTLDVILYDGRVSEAEIAVTQPIKIWKFSLEDLRPFEATSALGIGYQLALSWGATAPRQTTASVIARYINPAGREIYSTVSYLSMSPK